jgi:hypothetical protein
VNCVADPMRVKRPAFLSPDRPTRAGGQTSQSDWKVSLGASGGIEGVLPSRCSACPSTLEVFVKLLLPLHQSEKYATILPKYVERMDSWGDIMRCQRVGAE